MDVDYAKSGFLQQIFIVPNKFKRDPGVCNY